MIGGTDRISTGHERYQGYLAALAAHDLRADPALILRCPARRENGAEAIEALLKSKRPPTAAVCYNDVVAFGVMLGLRRLGLEAGKDFAVAGCDDIKEAALWTPALTSVTIDTAAMGEAAAELLVRRIGNIRAPRRQIVLEPKLVVRESSGGQIGLPPARQTG